MATATPVPPSTAAARPNRLPAIANAVLAAVLLVSVGAFALQVQQQPPPTVAEFAPQAKPPIQDAPPGQSTSTGKGPGQAAGSEPSPSPSPAGLAAAPSPSPPIKTPAILRCFGNPPRQTEDPQSPPCVPYFDPTTQNNGGATSVGVTSDFIYVALPWDGAAIERDSDTKMLAAYFNSRFQFYGRKLKILEYQPRGGAFGSADPAQESADAAFVAKDLNNDGNGIFASLSYVPRHGAEHYYYDALAKPYGIISVDSTRTASEEDHWQQYAPYEWSFYPGLDSINRSLGSLICQNLAGSPPRYVGAPPPSSPGWPAKRTFGIAWTRGDDGSIPDRTSLVNRLSACGAPLPVDVEFDGSDAQATSVISSMAGQNPPVSSVYCLCGNGAALLTLTKAASKQAYFPEFLVSPFGFEDVDSLGYNGGGGGYPPEHQNHIIGITANNKFNPPGQTFWYQALREVQPSYTYSDNGSDIYDYYRYEELMVLASGIQLAGPNLTPAAFQQGLFKAHFPNPNHGAAPYYQAAVGFDSGVHAWIQDFAPTWWSSSAQNYTTYEPRNGSYCYVDHGIRYSERWPPGPLAFYGASCR